MLLLGMTAALHGVQVTTPAVGTTTFATGVPLTDVVTTVLTPEDGDPPVIANGVNLIRVGASTTAVMGVMRDDGAAGDATAGDGVYSLRVTFNEAVPVRYSLRASVALQGRLQRTVSSNRELVFQTGSNLATARVGTFEFNPEAPSQLGAPLLRAGTVIQAGGRDVGVTGADGTATVKIPAGRVTITALVPSSGVGRKEIQLTAGTTTEVKIPIELGGELIEPAVLRAAEVVSGSLPLSAQTLTIQVLRRNSPVRLTGFAVIDAIVASRGQPIPITSVFSLTPTGALRCNDPIGLRFQLGSLPQPVSIEVQAWDSDGFSYHATTEIRFPW